MEESCGYNYLSCGATVQGSTLGFPNFIPNHETGIGDGGDAFYLITVWRLVRLTATTCGTYTDFDARLSVYDGVPTNSTLLATSDPSKPCASVFTDLTEAGTYFIVVGGAKKVGP